MNSDNIKNPLFMYVDVDDTLIRSFGTKRSPIVNVVNHLKELKNEGITLYCWSSGGGDYAKSSAEELGIADLFVAFLPKPHVLLDDQKIEDWRFLVQVHPINCTSNKLEDYNGMVQAKRIAPQF
jgi:hypothetical protein